MIERLGADWPVIAFDTFGGFPPRRSPLDMYDHPGCVFTDLPAVQRYLDGRNVEIVAGDIPATSRRLEGEDLVVSFIDTDNYTSALRICTALGPVVVGSLGLAAATLAAAPGDRVGRHTNAAVSAARRT